MLKGLNLYKNDLIAGFSVFLLALPLCLGIAMASDFPPIAGIITAIVGGLISSFVGSARLSIKGPAAGLIVITLGSVHELGQGDLILGYKLTLAVGVVAAVFQILISIWKKAVIAEIMPTSVIHGMLAAIGVIIVSKQVHVMMGTQPTSKTPFSLLSEVPQSLSSANPKIFLIGALALVICFVWPKLKKTALVPASIVILIAAIALSFYFNIQKEQTYTFNGQSYALGTSYLISLPKQILSAITLPNFSQITSLTSIKYIVMFTLVGSIESLLTVCAIDTIDPQKKKSDLNKDLMAVGVGNLISSTIGGLPMISEIVRSKANIDYGAKTSFSNFFHGLLLLCSILFIPDLIQTIPLTALAALLVFTGLRLASYKEFSHAYKIGKDQFLLFTTTLAVTLAFDLLIGVAAGILLKLIIHLIRAKNLKSLFRIKLQIHNNSTNQTIAIQGPFVFTHILELKQLIKQSLENDKKLILDLNRASFIDHTMLEKLKTLKQELTSNQLEIIGTEQL